MTEAERLTATDPQPMLEFVVENAADRKRRLFSAVSCRRIRASFTDERRQLGKLMRCVAGLKPGRGDTPTDSDSFARQK